jgi:DNA-binding transcriptional ArsR family regulator
MDVEREALRDWHRLFGLLLTDFFSGSPFVVEVERDLSVQQQLLDVAIVRRGRGRFVGRLPDGLEGLRPHNLMTFKSHHEALDGWAMKELVGLDVAYRKLVSPTPSERLPEDQFGLYAVAARFPHNLSGQVPWQRVQAGVYDCRWGTDTVRVIVAGELPREEHNAPLHLFSASSELVGFASGAYRRRSEQTSRLLGQLFERLREEGLVMAFTMEDFNRQYVKEHFSRLTPEERREVLQSLLPEERREVLQSLPLEERREVLQSLPAEELLAVLSADQIRQHLERLTAGRPAQPRKARRKR